MEKNIFNVKRIYLNVDCNEQIDAFNFIASKFVEEGLSNDIQKCIQGMQDREKEGTTGFTMGIAIPHAKIAEINAPGVFVFKFKKPIEWESLDDEPIKIAIALAIPKNDPKNDHIRILSSIARSLVSEEFKINLINAQTAEQIYEIISGVNIK